MKDDHKGLLELHADCPGALDILSPDEKLMLAEQLLDVLEVQLNDEKQYSKQEWMSVPSRVLQLAITLASTAAPLQARVSHLQLYVNLLEAYHSVLAATSELPELPTAEEVSTEAWARHIRQLESASKPFAQITTMLELVTESDGTKLTNVCDAVSAFRKEMVEKACEICKGKLGSSIKWLQNQGMGGTEGRSWKQKLSSKPTWAEIKKESANLVDVSYAAALKSAFTAVNQDWEGREKGLPWRLLGELSFLSVCTRPSSE